MTADCQQAARVVDFVAGELSASEQREFENHVLRCTGCREGLASHRQLIARLHSLPALQTSRDLAPLVLARIHDQPREFPNRKTIWLGAAAAVALLAFLTSFLRDRTPASSAIAANLTENSETSSDRAINWLCANQEADGSWDAEKWGGSRNFEIALTALPAIAVIGRNPTTPERAAAAARAIQWLRAQQSEDGTIGPSNFGTPYNHGLATLALLYSYRQNQDQDLRGPIGAAITAMVRAQTREGGWGWTGSLLADKTITAWHVEALRLADELGMENSKAALGRGLAWVAAHPDLKSGIDSANNPTGVLPARNDGAPGKAGFDLCSSYFLTITLQRARNEVSDRHLAAIRRSLIHLQIPQGDDSGSWPPDDRWGSSGGRIYSTALATLSLESL